MIKNMSKETSIYCDGAIASGIDAARDTADTYITAVDENGITVHPARSNWSTTGGRTNINASGMTVYVGSDDVAFYGATARIGKSNSDRVTVDSTNGITIYKGNSKRLQTTANGVDVYGSNGSTSIASFGSSTRIGKPYVSGASNNESHMALDYHSMQMVDQNGNTYLYVSEVIDADGNITDVFTGDGQRYQFWLRGVPDPLVSIRVNGADYPSYTYTSNLLTLPRAPSEGAVIEVTYKPSSTLSYESTKAFTFGSRGTDLSSDVGFNSFAEGSGVIARGSNSHAQNRHTVAGYACQTAIGKYNANSSANAFEVGNGTADDARSNAFAVGWDGTVTTARDTLITETSKMSSIMTAGSGITIDIFKFCQRSNVASILLRAKKSTVTAASTAISVGTVVAGRRPPFECAGPGTSGVGDCWVDDTGSVKFRSTSQIAANANFYVRVTYPIA